MREGHRSSQITLGCDKFSSASGLPRLYGWSHVRALAYSYQDTTFNSRMPSASMLILRASHWITDWHDAKAISEWVVGCRAIGSSGMNTASAIRDLYLVIQLEFCYYVSVSHSIPWCVVSVSHSMCSESTLTLWFLTPYCTVPIQLNFNFN